MNKVQHFIFHFQIPNWIDTILQPEIIKAFSMPLNVVHGSLFK